MAKPRDSGYVWVTWLAKLMAGEVQCQWATWFRTHYTAYTKAPSDFQHAAWVVEHTRAMDNLCQELSSKSLSYFRETQNNFKVNRGQMAIGGRPDLIALEADSHYTVYDVKTGQSRNSDIIQVMLYMAFLPYSTSGIYRGKTLSGSVIYSGGERTPIPSEALNDKFKSQITHFLDILAAPAEPPKVPSYDECQYCDITVEDCTARVKCESIGNDIPELPM